jgi:hypothetical protein
MSTLKKLLRANRSNGELLVTPRYEHYLATTPNILLSEKVARFVVEELTTPQRNRRLTFSASSQGRCAREQVFAFTPIKAIPKLNSELHAIFHQGTFMHLKWQALLLDAKILDQPEISCLLERYRLSGTVDGVGMVPPEHLLYGEHKRFGWEFKSTNARGYQWVLDRGPRHDHLLQIHAYMMATGWRLWSLMYENKDNQQYKEFTIHYDPNIAQEVEDTLKELNTYVDNRELPPVLDECQRQQGQFKKCSYAHACLQQHSWPSRTLKMRRS